MTVRAWFTISALMLLALTAAVLFQFLRPVPAPEILMHVGDTRIEGSLDRYCWPQRGGDLRCAGGGGGEAETQPIPASSTFRLVVAYPAQPEEGTVRVVSRDTGETVLRRDWARSVPYELEPGTYFVEAEARYPADAVVRYRFAFLTVTRSGS